MIHSLGGEYNRVILKSFTVVDCERMRNLRNRNRKWFVYSKEICMEDQKVWFKEYQRSSNDAMFSVFHKKSGLWIGAVSLYDICAQQAEFGRLLIDKDVVNEKKLGLDTTICACKIGFEQLNLLRIKLEVFTNNIAAIKIYEHSGFVRIGNSLLEDGREMILMELTQDKMKGDVE